MRYLLLALLLMFSSVFADEIDKSAGRIDNILITMYWFDTLAELQEAYEAMEEADDDRLEGFSLIERYDDHNMCHMDMFAVIPNEVDGKYTLTIGHEVVHCVFGEDYHEGVK